VVVGLHQRPGLVLPKGDGPSWCSRLCECLLADPPAEPLTIVDDLQASSRCGPARSAGRLPARASRRRGQPGPAGAGSAAACAGRALAARRAAR